MEVAQVPGGEGVNEVVTCYDVIDGVIIRAKASVPKRKLRQATRLRQSCLGTTGTGDSTTWYDVIIPIKAEGNIGARLSNLDKIV